MKADECHDESFGCENSVFGEAQDQTFEHFVTDRQSRFPQNGSQIVTTRLAAVGSVVLAKGHLKQLNQNWKLLQAVAQTAASFQILPAKSEGCAVGRARQSD